MQLIRRVNHFFIGLLAPFSALRASSPTECFIYSDGHFLMCKGSLVIFIHTSLLTSNIIGSYLKSGRQKENEKWRG